MIGCICLAFSGLTPGVTSTAPPCAPASGATLRQGDGGDAAIDSRPALCIQEPTCGWRWRHPQGVARLPTAGFGRSLRCQSEWPVPGRSMATTGRPKRHGNGNPGVRLLLSRACNHEQHQVCGRWPFPSPPERARPQFFDPARLCRRRPVSASQPAPGRRGSRRGKPELPRILVKEAKFSPSYSIRSITCPTYPTATAPA